MGDKGIQAYIQIQLLRARVFLILLYAAETRTLKKEDRQRLPAFEMRCYRRILNVWWKEHRTNENIRDEVYSAKRPSQTS